MYTAPLRPPPIAERAERGCRFLLERRNSDGGIPAIKLDDTSGCWSSAETLIAVMAIPPSRGLVAAADELTNFFLESQLRSGADSGAWPMVAQGLRGSVMATGHAIAALQNANAVLQPSGRRDEVERVVQAAARWLACAQVSGAGWGVEPGAGKAGAEPRTVSTYLALVGLTAADPAFSYNSSRAARVACDWLRQLQSRGGFPSAPGRSPDTCSTVRAITALVSAGADLAGSSLLDEATRFILDGRTFPSLWDLDTEQFLSDSAPGQTVFHMNTTAELLDFFVDFDLFPDARVELARWFETHQRDDGSWRLGANGEEDEDIVTWPTAEAVIALSGYLTSVAISGDGSQTQLSDLHETSPPAFTALSQSVATEAPAARTSTWRRVSGILLILVLLQALLLAGATSLVKHSWGELPKEFRKTIIAAAILAIAANLASSALIYIAKKMRRR